VIVFALAGLGLLQGGHCDTMPVTAATASASTAYEHATPAAADAPAVGLSVMAGHVHRGGPAGPAPTAENCQPVLATAAGTATAVTAPTSPAPHTSFADSRPALPHGRVVPAIALTAIGILRA
jgi:hypothetical protein